MLMLVKRIVMFFDENAIEDIGDHDQNASKDTIINAIKTRFIKWSKMRVKMR